MSFPTSPTLIYNAQFSDSYIDVSGSFDNGDLIAYHHGGPGVNQNFTLQMADEATGTYNLLSAVLKDQQGNLLPGGMETVFVVANNPDSLGPVPGNTLRGSSTGESDALRFSFHYVQLSQAWQIYTYRGGKHLFLTLEYGGDGTKLQLLEYEEQPRQLWNFRPAYA